MVYRLIWIWIIFNIFIGGYEIYCYINRDKLNIIKYPKWNSSIIATWNEYCRVDPRYAIKNYVWTFEILNAYYALISLILIFIDKRLIQYVLLMEIITCSIYFISLIYEYNNDINIKKDILKSSTLMKRILYYGISSIWIILPLYLYYLLIKF
jgi:hypothetical protein